MARSSTKSSKTTKHEKRPKPPAEHEPVKSVIEVPIALVEIKSLSKEILKCLDGETYITGKANQIITLAQSCIKTMKVAALLDIVQAFEIDREEKRLIDTALTHYLNDSFAILTLDLRDKCEAMIALFEALQIEVEEPQVNNNEEESDDRVPFVPGMSEKIDRDIELVNEMKERG